MALPINTSPTYTLTVPSTKEKLKYRPFLVKEQKALLLAQQSEDPTVMMDTLKGIIKSSVTGGSETDVDKLSLFDIEYIFLQLRAKSVGEDIELIFKCSEDHGDQNEKAKVKVTISIDDIKVRTNEDHNNKIPLFEDVGVVMKYPSLDTLTKFQSMKSDDSNAVFEIMAQSIDYVYNSDEVFYMKEQSKEEIKEFIDNLTTEQFDKLQKFFETMPKLSHDVEYECPVCSKHNKVTLEGLDSFF